MYHETHIYNLHTISMSWVPADLCSAKDEARLPNRPKARGETWESAQRVALANPSDIHKWDALFAIFDQEAQHTKSVPETHDNLKKAAASCYSKFLLRFPYATSYWKRFSILQYKLHGPHASISCLKDAVRAHPQSVVLWGDYLAGLVAMEAEDWKAGSDAKDSKYTVEFIRSQFFRAEALIGYNFNSDSFWDKYIAFEISVAQRAPNTAASSLLLALYLRLLRVPLYQYAQYYAQFGEFSKSFEAKDVVPAEDAQEYLGRFGKSDLSELSVIESSQLVDLYAYDIFLQTQQAVTERWQFESAITTQDFSPPEPVAAEAEYPKWLEYLAHEKQAFEALQKKVSLPSFDKEDELEESLTKASQSPEVRRYLAVQSVFERSLVPNCMNEELWIMYIDFVAQSTEDANARVRQLYEKAIYTFLPLSCEDIRKKCADHILQSDGFDATCEFWLKLIRFYSGDVYAKEAYISSVRGMIKMWSDQSILENLCSSYFNRVDRYKKDSDKPETVVKAEHASQLARCLNDDGICVVAVQYLRLLESSASIRSFYNKYHTQSPFSRSVQFWKFFMDFEIAEKNLQNVKTIMDYVQTSTELPKRAIDCFLDMQYEVTTSNLPQAYSSPDKNALLEILVSLNAKKSDDLVVNGSARKRLAELNFLEEKRSTDREKSLMKTRSKHLAHPGIFVDQAPEITNSSLGKWVDLLADDLKVPPMPVFRNVDKANAPIVYPDE